MSDILSAVLDDMASDFGIVVQLPPPPTSPSIDSLSLAEPRSPFTTSTTSHTPATTPSRSRKRPHSPATPSITLFTPPATPRTPQFLTPHSKRIRATSATSPLSGLTTPCKMAALEGDVEMLLHSLVRRSPRLCVTPSRPLSQLLTEGGGSEMRVRSAACTPSMRRVEQSQHSRKPKPFLTPQPHPSQRGDKHEVDAAFLTSLERRRHSDGSRLSSKRYQAALSLHAATSSSAAVSQSPAVIERADHLSVPVVGVYRSPPASPSRMRADSSTRSSKVLFGPQGG